ncbi:MAG: response regulator [Deltaproteobacteria bacterium]|nr:MAG: response regulator [Deltaproteobacteria bacterium]
MKQSLLIAEDEEVTLALLRNVFGRSDLVVHEARTGQEAVQHIDQHPVDVILTDLKMPGTDGLSVLAHARKVPSRSRGDPHDGPRDGRIRRPGDEARRVPLHHQTVRHRRGRPTRGPGPRTRQRAQGKREPPFPGPGTREAGKLHRRERGDEGGPLPRPEGGGHRLHGPDHGRERDGEGAHRAGPSLPFPALRAHARPHQLLRHPRGTAGERALRAREGGVHGGPRGAGGKIRGGPPRHDLPGRDRGDESTAAGETAPGAAGEVGDPRRRKPGDPGGRAGDHGDQQGSRGGDLRGEVPLRSLLPPERDPDPDSAAPGPTRRHPPAGRTLRREVQPGEEAGAGRGPTRIPRDPAALHLAGKRAGTGEPHRAGRRPQRIRLARAVGRPGKDPAGGTVPRERHPRAGRYGTRHQERHRGLRERPHPPGAASFGRKQEPRGHPAGPEADDLRGDAETEEPRRR